MQVYLASPSSWCLLLVACSLLMIVRRWPIRQSNQINWSGGGNPSGIYIRGLIATGENRLDTRCIGTRAGQNTSRMSSCSKQINNYIKNVAWPPRLVEVNLLRHGWCSVGAFFFEWRFCIFCCLALLSFSELMFYF